MTTATDLVSYNTLVVAVGVGAVGFAAGVVGSLCVLRKRALAGDAAAHATLVGVACAFLATGRRDLLTLLAGALVRARRSAGRPVALLTIRGADHSLAVGDATPAPVWDRIARFLSS